MHLSARLPLSALVAALALAGCNTAPKVTDNALVDANEAVELNDTAFNDQAPVVEEAGAETTPAVAVAAVPTPPRDAPAAEVAPVEDASGIEDEIRAGRGIERVRYGDGWAWTRNGQILRTADRDGRNVSYFRSGQRDPFFVQRGDRSYAYENGRPVRRFDRDGRPRAIDQGDRTEAERVRRDARERRDEAERARDEARRPDRQRPGRAQPSVTPTPTASPTASPSPSPSHSPSPRWREPQRRPGEDGRSRDRGRDDPTRGD